MYVCVYVCVYLYINIYVHVHTCVGNAGVRGGHRAGDVARQGLPRLPPPLACVSVRVSLCLPRLPPPLASVSVCQSLSLLGNNAFPCVCVFLCVCIHARYTSHYQTRSPVLVIPIPAQGPQPNAVKTCSLAAFLAWMIKSLVFLVHAHGRVSHASSRQRAFPSPPSRGRTVPTHSELT